MEVTSGEAAARLIVPARYAQWNQDLLDVAYRAQGTGRGFLPTVGIERFPPQSVDGNSDSTVLLKSITYVTDGRGLSTPAGKELEQEVRAKKLVSATFTSDLGDAPRKYTVHAQIEKDGDTRFAVVLLASAGAAYDALSSAVLPTVAVGRC